MEVRGTTTRPGGCWLASKGKIHAWALFGQPYRCESLSHFESLAGQRRLEGASLVAELPYKDVGSSEKFQSVMTNASPCLTKTRLQQAGYYIPKLRRRLLLQEAAALQGLPSQVLQAMSRAAEVHGLSPQTIAGSIGDAMSINVLTQVVMAGMTCAGMAKFSSNPWRNVSGEHAPGLTTQLFQTT